MPGSYQRRGEKYLLTVSAGTGLGGKRTRHTKTIEAKNDDEAEAALSLFYADVVRGKVKNDGKLTVKGYSEFWLKEYAEKRLEHKTYAEYKKLLPRIVAALGHIRLSNLKAHHLTQFYNMLREDGIRQDGKEGGLSESTISHYHRLLSTMLQAAVVESDLIPDNPAKKVLNAPRPEKKEAAHYDDLQAIDLLEALEDAPIKYKTGITLLVFAGLRKGELMGLGWDDIDFKNNIIHVAKASQYTKEHGIYEKDPKNYSSKRSVMVPKEIMVILTAYKAWQNEERLKGSDKWDKLWKDHKRLFTQWNGKPMHPDTISSWFSKFLKSKGLPGISVHGLRHTNASILINSNTDVATVSARLGHANKTTTMNVYSHLFKKNDKTASAKLSNKLLKKPSKSKSKKA